MTTVQRRGVSGIEQARCGRLLIGQGDEIYDPTCLLPEGHGGVCSPRTRWGCECGAIWRSDTTEPPSDRMCSPTCPQPPLFEVS